MEFISKIQNIDFCRIVVYIFKKQFPGHLLWKLFFLKKSLPHYRVTNNWLPNKRCCKNYLNIALFVCAFFLFSSIEVVQGCDARKD